MPAGAAAQAPVVFPSKGPMALGWAVPVILVLSALWAYRAVPPLEPGQQHGVRWARGVSKQAQAEPLPLPRRRRDDGGQQPPATTLGHSHAATMLPSSNQTDSLEPNLQLGFVPPPEPFTNASLQQGLAVPTTADLRDETNSPETYLLPSSVPPTAPSTDASLQQALVVPTTTDPQDERDSSDPGLILGSVPPPAPDTSASLQQRLAVPTTTDPEDKTDSHDPHLLLGSVPPPAPDTSASLQQGLAVLTTTDPEDETDSSHPELLLGSVPPPAPDTSTRLQQGLAVPTTMDPEDETDSSDPDLILCSVPPPAPSTEAASQKSFTTILGLTLPSKEGTAGSGTDGGSVTSPTLRASTMGDKVNKSGSPYTPTPSATWHTKPEGTTEPAFWEPSGVLSKSLLVMLLLALVAAIFMVSTGVLGILLWRRARSARHRLNHTEMICISSLLPDSEVPTNGLRAAPAQRPKPLLNGSSEVDGDNLTLSSFLPEHC